jgi:translocation and assembly module TamB
LACGNGNINGVRVGLSGSGDLDLSDWRLVSRVRTGSAGFDAYRAQEIAGTISLSGDANFAGNGRWDLALRAVETPYASSGVMALRGEASRGADAVITASGDVSTPVMRAGPQLNAVLGRLRLMDDSTPVGPLARAFAVALQRAGSQSAFGARYAAKWSAADGLNASVGDIAVNAASGARISLDGAEALAWSDNVGLALNTRLSFGGGGLPQGNAQLLKAGTAAPLTGTLTVAPYSAGGAVMAITPLRFTARNDGSAAFDGGIALSGPLNGGRVERLSMPLTGSVSADGTIRLAGGCRTVQWQAIRVGAFAVGNDTLNLCTGSGAGALAFGPPGLAGSVTIPASTVAARIGGSPAELSSGGGSLSLGDGRFALRNVRFGIGNDGSGMRIAASRLDGSSSARGFAGQFAGADLTIGQVPLRMAEGAGQWRFENGALRLAARLGVRDAQSDARFQPMVSDDIIMAMADGRIAVRGTLREQVSGVRVADLTIDHRLDTASGRMQFTVPGITFARGGLQPVALSRLALGVVADAEGSVTGSGAIRWTSDGVTSNGRFTTDSMNLSAAFGPVQRLSGTIEFDDLIGLRTPPGQLVQLGSVNPGIEVLDGQLRYQLLADRRVRIEGGSWDFAGGKLRMQPALFDFSADVPRRMAFDVERIDAGLFLQRYQFDNIAATGVFDGVLPTVFDADGGRVEGGSLVSRSGGELAYVGELSNRDLGTMGNMAFGALRSLQYDSLVVRLNGRIDGEMLTEVGFGGLAQGEGASNNMLTRALRRLPFTFNIRINAPFRQLLTSARGLYDPTLVIEQNLPALIRAQNEAAAARAGATPPADATPPVTNSPVQPPDSERRP